MQPAIAPVAPGSVFSRRASSDVASAASAMLRAISASPPSRAWKSMATSVASHALGSRVPVQSNSSRNPLPRPCEIVTGCRSSCRSGACVEKRRTFRRAQPFVAVAGVPVRAESAHVERHLRRSMRAVDQHRNARRVARRDDALQRQHQRAARGDVVDHGKLRAWRQRRCDVGDDRIGVGMRERHRGFHHACADPLAQVADGVAHRAVAVASARRSDRPA